MSRVLSALFCALLAAGCSDAPLGPATSAGSSDEPAVIADGPSATGPLFLLGGSPLIILDPTTKELNVTVEVTRGLTQAGTDDRFFLRSSAEFSKPGGTVAVVDPKDDGITAGKDGDVRGGGKVAIGACIEIPTEDGTCDGNVCTKSTWEKLVEADDSAKLDGSGRNPDVTVTVQLILIDGAGNEHVLDEASRTAAIDPKDSG